MGTPSSYHFDMDKNPLEKNSNATAPASGSVVAYDGNKLDNIPVATLLSTYFSLGSSASELNLLDASAGSPGTLATLTGVTSTTQRFGNIYVSKFVLSAYSLAVTDAAGSGSHGAVKLMDFPEGFIAVHKCSQVYTAFTADGTGVTGTVVFDIGVGSVLKAAAADGALGGATDDDIGGEIAVTLGTTTLPVTLITSPTAVLDGSAASLDIALNWSGTAATVDGNGTIAITGWIEVVWSYLGDD